MSEYITHLGKNVGMQISVSTWMVYISVFAKYFSQFWDGFVTTNSGYSEIKMPLNPAHYHFPRMFKEFVNLTLADWIFFDACMGTFVLQYIPFLRILGINYIPKKACFLSVGLTVTK